MKPRRREVCGSSEMSDTEVPTYLIYQYNIATPQGCLLCRMRDVASSITGRLPKNNDVTSLTIDDPLVRLLTCHCSYLADRAVSFLTLETPESDIYLPRQRHLLPPRSFITSAPNPQRLTGYPFTYVIGRPSAVCNGRLSPISRTRSKSKGPKLWSKSG